METKAIAVIALKSIFCLAVMLGSVIGNSLVLAVVCRNPRLRTITNAFVINFAVSDILMALFCMPLTIISLITVDWSLGDTMCKFQAILGVSLSFISLQIMTVTAVNRYFRIVHPRKYPSIFTKRSTIIMITAIWLIGLGFGELYVWAGGGEVVYILKSGTCCPRMVPLVVAIFGYVIPSMLMFLCYLLVVRVVRRHSLTVTCTLRRGQQLNGPSCEELKATKILFVVMLGFIICWVPTQVIGFILAKIMKTLPPEYPTVCFTLTYLSSAINPVIYGVMNHKFRKEFKNLLLSAKDGLANLGSILMRRRCKTSPADQQEVVVLQAIRINPVTPTCQCIRRDGKLSEIVSCGRSRNEQHHVQESTA